MSRVTVEAALFSAVLLLSATHVFGGSTNSSACFVRVQRDAAARGLTLVPIERNFLWCGARCLFLIVKAQGVPCSFEDIKGRCESAQRPGSTPEPGVVDLATLAEVARSLGFRTAVVEADLNWLEKVGAPLITVHDRRHGNDRGSASVLHAQLFLSTDGRTIRMIDPAVPSVLQSLSYDEFADTWTGYAMYVSGEQHELSGLRWTTSRAVRLLLFLNCAFIAAVAWVLHRHSRRTASAVLLCAASQFVIGCADRPVSHGPREEESAELEFVEADYEFTSGELSRRAAATSRLRHTYSFVNNSAFAARVLDVESGCSCTVADYSESLIAPGATGQVTLIADLRGRVGRFTTSAEVIVAFMRNESTVRRRSYHLTLGAELIPDPTTSPRKLEFVDVPAGAQAVKRLLVSVPVARDADCEQPVELRVLPPFSCNLVDVERVRGASLDTCRLLYDVQYAPTEAGVYDTGTISIRFANSDESLSVPLTALASHPTIRVEPSRLILGALTAAGVQVPLHISSRSGRTPAVQVLGVSPSLLAAVLTRTDPEAGKYTLHVRPVASTASVIRGNVLLSIADEAGAPLYHLPFVGVCVE